MEVRKMSNALTEFLRHCEPVQIPASCQQLGLTNSIVYRPPTDLDAVLLRLQELFDINELLGCGLLQNSPDGAVVNNALGGADAWLLPHMDRDVDEVMSISTGAGLLTTAEPCRVRSLEVALTQEQRSEAEPRLLIVFDVDTLALVTSLGFVARTSNFLADNDPLQLEAICELFGWEAMVEGALPFYSTSDHLLAIPDLGRIEQAGAESEGYSESLAVSEAYAPYTDYTDLAVILVASTRGTLNGELPAGLLSTLAFLKQVQAVFGRDLSNVSVWRPSEASQEGFRFALEHGTPVALQRLVYFSLVDDCQSLSRFSTTPVDPLHFADLFEHVVRLAPRGPNSAEFMRAVSELHKAQSRELIRPLLEMTVPVGPVGRSQQAVAAILQQQGLTQYCDLLGAMACGQSETAIAKRTAGMLATYDRVLRSLKYLGNSTW